MSGEMLLLLLLTTYLMEDVPKASGVLNRCYWHFLRAPTAFVVGQSSMDLCVAFRACAYTFKPCTLGCSTAGHDVPDIWPSLLLVLCDCLLRGCRELYTECWSVGFLHRVYSENVEAVIVLGQ